jgi:hypothetical protein
VRKLRRERCLSRGTVDRELSHRRLEERKQLFAPSRRQARHDLLQLLFGHEARLADWRLFLLASPMTDHEYRNAL